MKKPIILTLALILALSLAACGGNSPTSQDGDTAKGNDNAQTNDDNGDSGNSNVDELVDDIIDNAVESNSFSLAAAFAAMKRRGVEQADVEPEWEYTVDEEKNQAYGDTGEYGNGVIRFTKADGSYLTDEEYEAWAKKLFDATAKISDDGHNIYGHDVLFGENPGADVEITFDDAMGKGSDAMIVMQGWGYKYNGNYIRVNIEQAQEKDSEYEQNASGEWVWIHYYNGVQADVATGLQQSFDDTWDDVEDAFDEYGDEIQDALDDFAN